MSGQDGTITTWEPLTGRSVPLTGRDARRAYIRLQDAARVPLTLAVREELQGRSLRERDAPGEPFYCACCLADLPAQREAQDAHVCGEAVAAPGDVVWYRGAVPAGYGRLYVVGTVRGESLRLYDCGQALDVPAHEVTVIRRAAESAA